MNQVFLKDRKGNIFPISKDIIRIGRSLDNDIVYSDLSVSRYHLALQIMDNGILVSNTGTEAGFYINKNWYSDTAVAQSGDIIKMGNQEFLIEVPETIQTNDFTFTSQSSNQSGTSSLDVNSQKTKRIRIALVLVVILMFGLALLPEETPQKEPQASTVAPTEGLPTDSYSDIDVPRLGPQELTAEDLYKRGTREFSNKNYIRAIQYFQQSLVEDPSLIKSEQALEDTKNELKKLTDKIVADAEKNYKDSRLSLSRAQANHALNLLSEQVPGFSFQVQQKQRTLATQRLPLVTREQVYLEMPCDQTPEEALCKRAVEILKRSRLKLGEENVLK